ncbi:MAG: SDR family NAD(P)-dependent oxidoreductase [Sebaldella sp.]|nr:SDR family NAD(P)-dependent oxidoreductase [Sebaldella sp.]
MKYTVITGASSGIGYQTSLAFAKRNKNLIIASRQKNELEELKRKLLMEYPDLDIILKVVDLSYSLDIYEFYESLKKYEIETWVNNAGLGDFSLVSKENLSKIENMIDLNIKAVTILSALFVQDYSEIEGTKLINVSSNTGYIIVGNAVIYCATKFYVSAFTEGLIHELKQQNSKMKVKILAPGRTETQFGKTATGLKDYNYQEGGIKYHTPKEMADFLLKLYDSEYSIGLVSRVTGEFEFSEPIFEYMNK